MQRKITSQPMMLPVLLSVSATVATLAPLTAQAQDNPDWVAAQDLEAIAPQLDFSTQSPSFSKIPQRIAQAPTNSDTTDPNSVKVLPLPGSQPPSTSTPNQPTSGQQQPGTGQSQPTPTPNSTTPPTVAPGTAPVGQPAPSGTTDPNAAPTGDTPSPVPDTTAPNAPAPGETPPPPPTGETTPPADNSATEPQEPEKEVLVSEVAVQTPEGNRLDPELEQVVYSSLQNTRPGLATTRSQLQVDINSIFATGYFNNVRAEPSDTPLGVKVTFVVTPNPVLRSVQLEGNKILPQEEVDKIFQAQIGKTLNLIELRNNIKAINKYYQDKGYILGQVLEGATQISPDGNVTLQVAEGVVERIDIRFQNKEGEPTKGKTRPFIITREMKTKPGEVINKETLQKDLQRVFGLGMFEDIQPSFEPGEDPRKVALTLTAKEKKTGNFSAGAGFSSSSGLFGTASYSQGNLGGNNQKLNTQIQIGTREYLFDASFTDPWIATDPYHTSYTVNVFNRLTRPLVFDGGDTDINLGDFDPATGLFTDSGETPRVNRLGGGVTFTRPFTKDLEKIRTAWTASAGIQYQRVSIRDADFNINNFDQLGNSLSFSGKGEDDLLMVQLGLSRDLRNDPQTPTKGSVIRIGLDQSVPVGLGSITMTRLRGSYSYFVPVKLTKFTKGPQALAFNVQAGTVLGDLPPYEAFTLGGSNSVRGYGEGEVGSGRSFVQATAEYRFPLLKFLGGIGGVLFVDAGTTLGTQDNVPGSPGLVRDKPGWGVGYGVGIRIKTPIGPIRLDYGWNVDGGSRFQFGFGEKF